jgi:hypothetical protein
VGEEGGMVVLADPAVGQESVVGAHRDVPGAQA